MAVESRQHVRVKHFETLPVSSLRPSALVDFILFFSKAKPAVRSFVDTQNNINLLRSWCSQTDYYFVSDQDNYFCIAIEPGYADYVLQLDCMHKSHELELGRALGYPVCCCNKIASIGESAIDSYAAEVATWEFKGDFQRINPSHYMQGLSLISHLPCSPTCFKSLSIANKSLNFIINCPNNIHMSSLQHYATTML